MFSLQRKVQWSSRIFLLSLSSFQVEGYKIYVLLLRTCAEHTQKTGCKTDIYLVFAVGRDPQSLGASFANKCLSAPSTALAGCFVYLLIKLGLCFLPDLLISTVVLFIRE